MAPDWSDYPTGIDPILRVLAGRLLVKRDVGGPAAATKRDLLVLLPPSYHENDRPYPVIYMQDGQNLFDPATSFAGAWRVGRALEKIRATGLEAIIVGVPHGGAGRIDEYSPFADARIGGGEGDAFVSFLADTVKPLVDGTFRTALEPRFTCVAGSSMGGLISLYALFRRGDVFGVAGAMSPALWFARRSIYPWLADRKVEGGKIYLDAGTAEGPLLLADVARLRDQLIDCGLRLGHDLECVFETGGGHDEVSWGRRLPAALRFMLESGARPSP